jgi:hypothetical protein
MKTAILAFCTSTLAFSTLANAGVNRTYRVRGAESENGNRYPFSGTVTVSNYNAGKYQLKFEDGGGNTTFSFKFVKPLKESNKSQTVNAYNKLGTSVATFYQEGGKFKIEFTYRSKDGSVRGSGKGSK